MAQPVFCTHTLFWQICPVPQICPQLPQLAESDVISAHAVVVLLVQQACVPTQAAPPPQLHRPRAHCSLAPQLMLQPPQLRLEMVVSTQVEPQQDWVPVHPSAVPHLHTPPEQVSLAPHA